MNTTIPASEYVMLVEVLELIRPYEEFEAVILAAVRRLETEGIAELVTLQFYAAPNSTEAGAILIFSDREQIMRHIQMITGWEEFQQLLRVVKPVDVRVYGKMSAEAEEWVGGFGVLSKTFPQHVSGFVR
jgi:hypothetical protein